MSARKERVTVTLDPALVEAGNAAVAAGRADSLSAWVNQALADHALKERRLAGLAKLVADWEAEHGEITQDDLEERERSDRANAIKVRRSDSRGRKRRPRSA